MDFHLILSDQSASLSKSKSKHLRSFHRATTLPHFTFDPKFGSLDSISVTWIICCKSWSPYFLTSYNGDILWVGRFQKSSWTSYSKSLTRFSTFSFDLLLSNIYFNLFIVFLSNNDLVKSLIEVILDFIFHKISYHPIISWFEENHI